MIDSHFFMPQGTYGSPTTPPFIVCNIQGLIQGLGKGRRGTVGYLQGKGSANRWFPDFLK